MIKPSQEWIDSISVIANNKGKDSWFTAYCPICGASQEATVIPGIGRADDAAKGKVAAHIKLSHTDRLTDPREKTDLEKGMDELKKDLGWTTESDGA